MINQFSILEEALLNCGTKVIIEDWDGVLKNISNSVYDKTLDGKNLPLILIHRNIGKVKRFNDVKSVCEFDATIYIIAESKDNYTTKQRIDEVYVKVIAPIFDTMQEYLFKYPLLIWDDIPLCEKHSLPCETEDLFFIISKSKEQNQLNRIVEAMQVNLTIKIRK